METAYKCCLLSRSRRFHSRNMPPPPEDVGALFARHTGGAPHMDEHGLRRCLGAYQGGGEGEGEGLDDDDSIVERLLEQIRGTGGGAPRITLDDFHRILYSHDVNPPIRRRRVRVYHDMTLPLSHYFIYSGHNPYYAALPADQRCGSGSGGGRSDEPIIRSLKMGVRAIEVAMWPNSREDDIKIYHGWTWNTPVTLAECLKSIKENAFVASPYPVIITLEDNLRSSNLQKKAAKIILDVLGDILYSPHADRVDIDGYAQSDNPHRHFPSPEELMGRVLLSTKPPSLLKKGKRKPIEVDVSKVHGTVGQGDDDDQLHVSKGADDDDAEWGPEVQVIQTEKTQSDQKRNDDCYHEDQRQYKEIPLYRHLFTIGPDTVLEIRTFKTIERISTLSPNSLFSEGRLSWSKQQIEEWAEKYDASKIMSFTQVNILRIYPSVSLKGYPRASPRLTSSNYNPFLGWVHGAQMVSLNMQEYGRALWLMHGFYRANGGCGYVRKPDCFLMKTRFWRYPPLSSQRAFDPTEHRPVKKTLKVKVYMGDGWLTDFKPAQTSFIPDLWASVGIAGVPADTTAMQNTKATEKTWVPVWEDEFSFPLTLPEIALLRVEVHHYDMSEKDVFGGQTVLPVCELRPGIRAVALLDRQGNRFDNVRLLMRFEFV